MIYTLTLNPALDLELTVPSIAYDRVLRAVGVRTDCGGKGFNISRAFKAVGVESMAMGWVGGKTGERLAEELAQLGVRTDLTWVPGETRTNVHILERETGRYIKVNQPGPVVGAAECDRMVDKVTQTARAGDLWLLTGSLPPGAPSALYSDLVRSVQQAGGFALVDADGDNLIAACSAKPTMVKPNALEAVQFAGFAVYGLPDARRAAEVFHYAGVKVVLITLGEKGAVLSQDGSAWWARPPEIHADIPTGAGDATMAGYAWGLSRNLSPEETLRLAVASGTASASLPGTAVAGKELIEAFSGQVVISRV